MAMLDPSERFVKLLREDTRYKYDAYAFVFEALSYAQNELDMGEESASEPSDFAEEEEETEGPHRHVTGQDLCEAIRRFALDQYGLMAKTVLNSWGVSCTGDFGEIVFNLIRIGRMRKTAEDRREDFDGVYDFDEAFEQDFQIKPPD
jgi:uncharacterized repeat protein (TIGR04138 family)